MPKTCCSSWHVSDSYTCHCWHSWHWEPDHLSEDISSLCLGISGQEETCQMKSAAVSWARLHHAVTCKQVTVLTTSEPGNLPLPGAKVVIMKHCAIAMNHRFTQSTKLYIIVWAFPSASPTLYCICPFRRIRFISEKSRGIYRPLLRARSSFRSVCVCVCVCQLRNDQK